MERLETIKKLAWQEDGAFLGERALWTQFADEVDRELMFRICSLATSAADIFCGSYPTQWPYGAILELRELPWFEDWHIKVEVRRKVVKDGELIEVEEWEPMYVPRKDVKERFFEAVGVILDRLDLGGVDCDCFSDPINVVVFDGGFESRKRAIQGLCAVMLCHLDSSIEALLEGNHRRVAIFLSSAYQCLSHLQIECEPYSSGRVRGGSNKNRANSLAREFVLNEWAMHRHEYEGNKSEFARVYARRVKHEMMVDVTEKTIREVWLSPSASR